MNPKQKKNKNKEYQFSMNSMILDEIFLKIMKDNWSQPDPTLRIL